MVLNVGNVHVDAIQLGPLHLQKGRHELEMLVNFQGFLVDPGQLISPVLDQLRLKDGGIHGRIPTKLLR